MRNRILKAPLAAGGIGLLAALAIPAAAQAGDGTTTYPAPAIQLDKTGAATANAGDTFTYSFAVTNSGNVTLTNVTLTDDKCQDTLKRDPAETDDAFDKGDVWHFTCTVIAPTGPAEVHNVATVTAKYEDKCKPKTVTATDDHTFTVPATPPVTPPVTPPAGTPPAGTPPAGTPPAGTPPAGGAVLPEQVVSGRAALRGPSGCVKQAFRARVSGRSIASVTFFMDGRRLKQVSGPGSARIIPKRIGFGRHRVVALVRFTEASGTPARRLLLTFRRCSRQVVNPQFTG